MEDKKFIRYTARGSPVYRDSSRERICSLEGCFSKSHNSIMCYTHRSDGNDYSEQIEKLSRPLNTYTLVNNEYYEMTVSNSDIIYKISKEDYTFAKSRNWWCLKGNKFYLIGKETIEGVVRRITYHAELLKDRVEKLDKEYNFEKVIVVDHINGDVLDNRRSNLRVRTPSENNMNKVIQSNNISGIAGVSWHKRDNIWHATISKDGKQKHLGNFYYFRNAVRARVKAEDNYFGEHAFRLRDKEYRDKIEEILNLPTLPEPAIKKRPNNEFNILGVSSYITKSGEERYRATIYIKETNKKQGKAFSALEEAIKWRKEKEVEFYGSEIMYEDEKKDYQI